MGRTKHDLNLGGRNLAQRAASTLWPFCSATLISIASGAENPVPDCSAVEDQPPPGRGPLAGIDAAFRASGQADLLVLACDYPHINHEVIRRMVTFAAEDEDDIILLTDDRGRDHPLVATWKRRTAPLVGDALERGIYRVRSLLPDLVVRRLGPGEFPGVDLTRALVNLNWPADLEGL